MKIICVREWQVYIFMKTIDDVLYNKIFDEVRNERGVFYAEMQGEFQWRSETTDAFENAFALFEKYKRKVKDRSSSWIVNLIEFETYIAEGCELAETRHLIGSNCKSDLFSAENHKTYFTIDK